MTVRYCWHSTCWLWMIRCKSDVTTVGCSWPSPRNLRYAADSENYEARCRGIDAEPIRSPLRLPWSFMAGDRCPSAPACQQGALRRAPDGVYRKRKSNHGQPPQSAPIILLIPAGLPTARRRPTGYPKQTPLWPRSERIRRMCEIFGSLHGATPDAVAGRWSGRDVVYQQIY